MTATTESAETTPNLAEVANFLGMTEQEILGMEREVDQMLAEMKRLREQMRADDREIDRDAAEAWAAIRQAKAILGI